MNKKLKREIKRINICMYICSIIIILGICFLIYFITQNYYYEQGYNQGYKQGVSNTMPEPIRLAIMTSTHSYNNNESLGEVYNCINFTEDYLKLLSQEEYQGLGIKVREKNHSSYHQLACVFIEPQTAQFVQNKTYDYVKCIE
jgi:hypothetical protein